jgi:LacI family transcriptional regulator
MVSIKDVARAAGVSISTVSRVINAPEKTSSEPRRRVEEAIERLNYRPNPSAQGVRNNVTGILGAMLPDVLMPSFAHVLTYIVEEAQLRKQSVLVSPPYRTDEEEAAALTNLMSKPLDALIYIPRHMGIPPRQLDFFVDVPIIGLARRTLGFPAPCVYSDNIKGGYMATRYLIQLGNTRIGFLAGVHRSDIVYSVEELEKLADSPLAGTLLATDRFNGYRKALAEAGIPYDPALVFICRYSQSDGQAAARYFLTLGGVEAVVAANDQTAGGVIRTLTEQGFRVPADVSVVGADDLEFATLSTPTLTTVRQNNQELGRQAVIAANRLIRKEPCPDVKVDVELIVRESTRRKLAPEERESPCWRPAGIN